MTDTAFQQQWREIEEAAGLTTEELENIQRSLKERQMSFALRHIDRCILACQTVIEHAQRAISQLQTARQALIDKHKAIYHLDPK